jgi:taurine dioxygenase
MAAALRAEDLDLDVTPCGPVLGAEVRGLRVGEALDVKVTAALRALLNQYKVLFLRDLDLTYEQHLALGRVFGLLEGHPVLAHVPG